MNSCVREIKIIEEGKRCIPPTCIPPRSGGRKWGVEVSSVSLSRRRHGFERLELLWRAGFGDADHAIARDQSRELGFAHVLGPRRAFGDDEVAHVGATVEDPHLDIRFQFESKLSQYTARIDDR